MGFNASFENETLPASPAAPKLMVVTWELTKSCNLHCAHCRGSSENCHYDGELTTAECFGLVDSIMTVGHPVLILTGGEPLTRQDFFDVAHHASSRGFMVALGTNGTLVSPEIAARLKAVPVFRVSVSLDFPIADLQDAFRGETGAYDAAMAGIRNLRAAGIDIQINSTVTRRNAVYLDRLLSLALDVGAVAFHPFMLVPTGRGKNLREDELPPAEYERTLNWMYDRQKELGDRIFFKPTNAPHYMRVIMQRQKSNGHTPPVEAVAPNSLKRHHTVNTITRGCLAGTGFCFISSLGRVQGCGFLDVGAGNVREQPFPEIWAHSQVFANLRDLSGIKGKCGRCEYKSVCGGCRARAYEATGDYMEAEPYCIYAPKAEQAGNGLGAGDAKPAGDFA